MLGDVEHDVSDPIVTMGRDKGARYSESRLDLSTLAAAETDPFHVSIIDLGDRVGVGVFGSSLKRPARIMMMSAPVAIAQILMTLRLAGLSCWFTSNSSPL
jgi:hypothetical protein